MAYRLDIAEALADTVRACAREQVAGAIACLEGAGEDPVEAIHDARKHVKKLRALLRLARPALGAKAYRAEGARLRDVGRALSAARDADVLVATVEALAQRSAGRLPAERFEQLLADLRADVEGRTDDAAVRAVALADLRDALERVGAWPLQGAGWDVACSGIARSYARGREAAAVARHEPSTEHLHEWRKRVKDLWYQERLLVAVWPPLLEAHGKQARALAELLGDEHDLAVLAEWIERSPAPAVDVLGLVRERREQLCGQAQRLGRRLYAESPKAFGRRLAAYMHAAGEQDGA